MFEKKLVSNFMKTRSRVLSCSMRVDGRMDGRTETTKLKVIFRNSATEPKKTYVLTTINLIK